MPADLKRAFYWGVGIGAGILVMGYIARVFKL